MPDIADLHAHCSLKSFLGAAEEKDRASVWDFIHSPFWNTLAPVLDSQSNLTQAKSGGVKLFFSALTALEQPIAKEVYYILKDTASLFPAVSFDLMRQMKQNEKSYFDWMVEEWHHLKANLAPASVLGSFVDFNPVSPDPQLVVNIEGAHNFYTRPGLGSAQDMAEMIQNLEAFKNDPEMPRAFYLTLTHLCNNRFANHAFAIKLVSNPDFFPIGNGINSEGYQLIDAALSTQNGYRMLIDVKHMSAKSRKDYYRHTKGTVPIIASHTGFSLTSWNDKIPVAKLGDAKGNLVDHAGRREDGTQSPVVHVVYPWRRGRSAFVHHNLWSINLYKEEVDIIHKSGGIVGVSLDQRILGYGHQGEDVFSIAEWLEVSKNGIMRVDEYGSLSTFQEYPGWGNEYLPALHAKHVANQLISMSLCSTVPDPYNHFALGSDFDGLIDAVDCCTDAAQYQNFVPLLERELFHIYKNDMGNPLKPELIQSIVQRVCFDNALHFLERNFNATHGF